MGNGLRGDLEQISDVVIRLVKQGVSYLDLSGNTQLDAQQRAKPKQR